MLTNDKIRDILIANQNEHQDQLLHYGVIGMKWGRRKSLGSSSRSTVAKNPKTGKLMRRYRRKSTTTTQLPAPVKRISRRKMKKLIKQQEAKKLEDISRRDRNREEKYIKEYENRDRMSTKAIKARTERLKAEQEFERVVYAKANERARRAAEAEKEKRERRAKRINTTLKISGAAATAAASYGLERMYAKPDAAAYGGKDSVGYKEAKAQYDYNVKFTKDKINPGVKVTGDFLKAIGGGK